MWPSDQFEFETPDPNQSNHGCHSVQDFKSHDHNDSESGSPGRERGGDINKGKFYQSNRHMLRLSKSLTDSLHDAAIGRDQLFNEIDF